MTVSVGMRICVVWAGDVPEDTLAAEAALCMNAICPATQHSHLASLIPEVRNIWLSALGPMASVRGNRDLHWAGHILKGAFRTKTALWIHTIGLATKHPFRAVWIPIVRHSGNDCELADMRSWTMDVMIVSSSTEAAMYVLTVGVTTMLAHVATGIPEIWCLWLGVESTRCCWRCRCAFRTCHPGKWIVPAETALGMNPIRPTPQRAGHAVVVPVVWHIRIVRKVTAARRTWHRAEVAASAHTTLDVPAITIAAKHTHLTIGVPERSDTDWLIVKLAPTSNLSARPGRVGLCPCHGKADES